MRKWSTMIRILILSPDTGAYINALMHGELI